MSDNPSTVIQSEPAVFTPPKLRPRVHLDAEAYQQIDQMMLNLPYGRIAPIVDLIMKHGGVQDFKS